MLKPKWLWGETITGGAIVDEAWGDAYSPVCGDTVCADTT